MLSRIHALLEKISRVAVWIGGGALLLCAFMVSIDVIMRKMFSITMSGSDEISGYVFAAATAWAYSYCLLHRSHIRIDALYGVLPTWLRSILDAIGLALLLFYMTYLTGKAIDVLKTSWTHDSVSITTLSFPQWIPQLLWVSGLCWFVVTLAFLLVYVLVSIARGDLSTEQDIAGAMSVDKQIDEETHGMDAVRKAG
ncbi:MAG: TRAP transporter small permease [Burkholderiales bacterium]|jgi:TRAP-type C4-dicarboxylate transport system permease small subunit